MLTYDELIKQSEHNVISLGKKLKDIDTLLEDINNAKKIAEGIPEIFNEKFQELVELSGDYTNTLGAATKKYLDGNNTLFTTKLSELSTQINNFVREIDRLVNTDFTKLFEDLQEVFIDQTRTDLAVELKKFDAKLTDLQSKIGELKKEITRLEKIDLEKHFRELQTTLSNIFNAVNGINATLTNVTQTLNGIVQSINAIQTSINGNHTATTRLLNGIADHLRRQDTFLENKIKSLLEQNQLLKSEIKTNRAIQIVGLILTLGILIYIAFGKYFPIIN